MTTRVTCPDNPLPASVLQASAIEYASSVIADLLIAGAPIPSEVFAALRSLRSALEQLRDQGLLPPDDHRLPVDDFTEPERQVLKELAGLVVDGRGGGALDFSGLEPGHVHLNLRIDHGSLHSSVADTPEGSEVSGSADADSDTSHGGGSR